jgi:dihydrofolate reductase
MSNQDNYLKKIIISAVAKNGVIGRSNGEIPWHSKEEFQHFKNTTLGFPIIMGRVTFDTLRKPLKGRLNIVISRNDKLSYDFTDLKIFNSLESAFSFCEENNYHKIFIIGGAKIYGQAIKTANEMIISKMDFKADGDVFFPKVDENDWKIKTMEKRDGFDVFFYVRNKIEN